MEILIASAALIVLIIIGCIAAHYLPPEEACDCKPVKYCPQCGRKLKEPLQCL